MKEIWKDVPAFKGQYQVSSLGNVRSLDRVVANRANKSGLQKSKGKVLKICSAVNGYSVVNLGRKTHFVHRLVCEAFYGDISDGYSVNHINGIKADNRAENLEIIKHSDNCKHAYRELGRKPSCEGLTNTGASKAVRQIDSNNKIVATYPSAREAERITGISHKHISSCCNGIRHTTGGFKWEF